MTPAGIAVSAGSILLSSRSPQSHGANRAQTCNPITIPKSASHSTHVRSQRGARSARTARYRARQLGHSITTIFRLTGTELISRPFGRAAWMVTQFQAAPTDALPIVPELGSGGQSY